MKTNQTKPLVGVESRNADYKLLLIAEKFEPIGHENIIGTCANFKESVGDIYEQVSAPYALARLCALFKGLKIETGGQEFYKTTWETVLKHKKSGNIITFYDYKGSISYGSNISSVDKDNKFIEDVKKLLSVLSNDRCPHPYDGCVVGEVA